ncbi:MAG TPA: aromatic amino acid ammonia-lyase [Acidimicrobiales bacterium]|nr:aromatic amino acid ammonia-lyase [Acidimicrobiales bacterium]
MPVVLDGASLTVEDLAAVAEDGRQAELAGAARARMEKARAVVEAVLRQGAAVYGLTTGVAERKRSPLPADAASRRAFNRLLVRSHRVAQGPLASPTHVRATMTCLVNNFARGFAGVRPELADMVLRALNGGFVPAVRTLGSVGEADLGPMADLAEALLSESGFALEENEGLALLNNNAFSTAWSALAFRSAETMVDSADVAAALDLEAFGANFDALHELVAEARPYPGIRVTLSNLRRVLVGSSLWEGGLARNLQDPLTFRCIPQVHGAARDVLAYARRTVETELNCAQGNPAVARAEERIIWVGNFDVLPVVAAMDFLRIALAPVLTSAAERTIKLLQSPISGLAPGLAAGLSMPAPASGSVGPDIGPTTAEPVRGGAEVVRGGAEPVRGDAEPGPGSAEPGPGFAPPEVWRGTPEDALAEFAVTSQALAIEARGLAHPVSYELVSTSKGEGIEDRATMAPLAARRLTEMVSLGSRILAIELMVAAQALDLRPVSPQGRGTQQAYRKVRSRIPFTGPGETPPEDLEPLVELVGKGELASLLSPG